MPRDGFGREIDYLRISLTDHCNLRCVYCMPEHGLRFLPAPDLLTAAEIEQVGRAAVAVGFRKFRLTGGEPTLRADLVEIVARLARIPGVQRPVDDDQRHPPAASRDRTLRAAGLRRVNVHLDSLDPARVARVMRWGTLADIWAGIEAAEAAGFAPIKLNAVVVARLQRGGRRSARGAHPRAHPWHVRFIETMPFGTGDTQADRPQRTRAQRRRSARASRRRSAPLAPLPGGDPSDESRNYRLAGARGRGRLHQSRCPSRTAAPATACASPPTAASTSAC